jgi:hypothetical protein
MTDTQLYFAIGVPVILNLLALLWQSRAVEKTLGARIDVVEQSLGAQIDGLDARIDGVEQSLGARIDGVEHMLGARIDSLEKVMNARFDAVDARFAAAHQALLRVEGVMDARLHALESRGQS